MANKGDKFLAKSIVPGVPDVIVIFKGIQETEFEDEFPSFALYDLTEDIPEHPKNSTVSKTTLEESGYVLPQEAP